MNNVEFNMLSLQRRASLIQTKGKYVEERVEYGKCIWKYYLLYDFVVEVEYNLSGNRLRDMRAFEPVPLIPNRAA
ncbi:MAG: hypothetical protein POELPBGB_01422 [Bacteroidia bacterium]|nr:hypothetical protein [Bacteroidia bacterium]